MNRLVIAVISLIVGFLFGLALPVLWKYYNPNQIEIISDLEVRQSYLYDIHKDGRMATGSFGGVINAGSKCRTTGSKGSYVYLDCSLMAPEEALKKTHTNQAGP